MALKWCFSDTKIVYILEVSDRFTQPKQYSRQITDNLGWERGECQLVVRRMLPSQLSGPGNNADWVLTESRDKCFAQSFQSPEMGWRPP